MRDLTRGSIVRHLLSMTLFLMGSMVFQSLYFLADLYWIGKLGRDAIAAVGLMTVAGLAYSASKCESCCYPGSPCCYPGSPCCDGGCCR